MLYWISVQQFLLTIYFFLFARIFVSFLFSQVWIDLAFIATWETFVFSVSPGAIRRPTPVQYLLWFNPCHYHFHRLPYFTMILSCLQICSLVWFGPILWVLIKWFPTNSWCITSEWHWVLNFHPPPVFSFHFFPSFTDCEKMLTSGFNFPT